MSLLKLDGNFESEKVFGFPETTAYSLESADTKDYLTATTKLLLLPKTHLAPPSSISSRSFT